LSNIYLMATVLYTLIVLSYLASKASLRGTNNDVVIKAEVCGNYYINGVEVKGGQEAIQAKVEEYLRSGNYTIKYGESTIFDVWEMDTALYC